MASAGTAQPSKDDGQKGGAAAGKAADTLAARFKDIERGKLAYAELQRLLDSASSSQPAASSKDAAAGTSKAAAASSSRCSLAELVAAADPVSSERLVDMLLRTGQSELLRQLLQACCHASTDLMVALLDAKAPLSLLQAVLEHHAEYAPGGSGRAWQAGVASSGWNGTDGRAYLSPGCQDVLAWHALQHPDTRVLAWLLSQPSIDPAVHLADGSNLLHAAVDLILRDTPAGSGEHVAVLIDAVRQRLTPRQLMADPSSGRLPPDQQFLHHRCPDGHTALYKVSAAVKAITYSQARRERGPLGLEHAGRAAIGAAAGAGRSLLQNLTTTKASRKKQKQQEAILRTIRKAQGQAQQDDSQPAEAEEDPAAAELRRLVQLERVGQVLLLNGGVDPLLEEAASTPGGGWGFLQGLGRSGPAQPAEGEGRAAGSTWLGSAVGSAAGWLGYGSGFLCETQSALDKLRERRTAEAEQAYDDAQYKQSLAAKTAFDALGIQEPVDQQQWSEEEFREVCRLWQAEREKRKSAKLQKAQALKADKAWYESTSGQESLKSYTGRYAHEPVNPWIEQEYKPLRGGFEDTMLRSVLRQLAVTAGGSSDVLDTVEQLLEDKPKVLDYVTKTYFKLKPGNPQLVLKVKEVFAGARESLAFSVLRAHPTEPQLLQPLLRANEVTLYQRDHTANILWLGLGAPGEAVFETLLDVSAPGGPKGNPLAVTYSTGGNLVHALLQHRPGDTLLLRRLLVKLSPTKATCRNAVNAVNEATQQTPLALAVSMQQLEMAELLVDFGADPLGPSLYPQAAAAAGSGPPAAAASGSSKHQQSPLLTQTTLLHLLLGSDRQLVLGADLLGTQARLRQACMDAAVAEAQAQRAAQQEREQYERDLVSGSAAEQIVARGKLRELSDVPRHVLGTYINSKGETLVLAAARYCCSTGDAQPLLQLLQAGADWTLPNERGVSALLLLLQHKARGLLPAAADAWLAEVTQQSWTPQMLLDVSACCSQAQAEDEELLLDLLMQLPWGSMLGLL